jgi:transaldolase
MVTDDIEHALRILRPVHDESAGVDGYVSVEVAPELARDCDGTVASARDLHDRIAEPNLYVKVPATSEGVDAIRILIGEGRSINVTLIFGLDRYHEVMEAYISGLEAYDGDLSQIASVASFFVSRVDTEVDRRLDGIGNDAALALRGKAAVAQAQLAYQRFVETFRGPRWQALADRGARVQRPLWASTSTKNPDYRDTLYVDTLIGPDTVNTMPEATLDAFEDHGTLARTVDADPDGAQRTLDAIEAVGVDLDEVSRVLEDQGVSTFAKSFDELISALGPRRSRHPAVPARKSGKRRPTSRHRGESTCTVSWLWSTTCLASSPSASSRRSTVGPTTGSPSWSREVTWRAAATRAWPTTPGTRSTGGRSTSTGATSGACPWTTSTPTIGWSARRSWSGWAPSTPTTRCAAIRAPTPISCASASSDASTSCTSAWAPTATPHRSSPARGGSTPTRVGWW